MPVMRRMVPGSQRSWNSRARARSGRQAERAADRRLAVPGGGGRRDRLITLPPGGADAAGPQRAAVPFGQAAPDAVGDPVAEGVVQARLRGPGTPRRSAARARPTRRGRGRTGRGRRRGTQPGTASRAGGGAGGAGAAVTRLAGRHRAGAVTRARHWAAKAARSATSRPLAANSSANRRGYRRVVLRVPRHTTVCGSAPAIASRRTVSRETPSRRASCAAVRKSAASFRAGRLGLPWWRDQRRGQGPGHCLQQLGRDRGGAGGSVWWWVFAVLGCMVGSCRRVLAPWVILADGPGGLVMPGFARARAVGDARAIGTRQYAPAHRAGSGAGTVRGGALARYPGISPLTCGLRIAGGESRAGSRPCSRYAAVLARAASAAVNRGPLRPGSRPVDPRPAVPCSGRAPAAPDDQCRHAWSRPSRRS